MSHQGKTYRLTSIDFLRGLVMVIMALDHVRDYFWDVRFDPLDLEQTNVVWYVTRWITNFCAPTFVLLAGLSAGLMARRRTKAELSRFLFTRGLWLIFIEVTVVTFAWTFQPLQNLVILQVIWAIGVSLIVMSALVWTPKYFIAAFAIIMVFGHNILDFGLFPSPVPFEVVSPFWHVLHNQVFTLDMGFPIVASYPIIPWIGVMPMGYLLAGLYRMEAEERQKWLIRIGLSAVILFFILRAINFYGDPNVWVAQKDMLWNILAFFNVTKYPPSLLYLLITLGPGLMMLGYAEKWRGRFVNGMVVFGQVPFFYYVLHLYVIHLAALLAAELQGFGWRTTLINSFQFAPEYGFGPLVVWALWFILILLLYPLCKWFADIKKRRSYWWLSYL